MKLLHVLSISLLIILTSVLTGCDEEVAGNPDFWANSYFGQTSPYPMGTLNPTKKEYKYSIPWAVTQTNDAGYLFGGLLRTFSESNAMIFKLNSKGVVEKAFVIHDGTKKGQDRQSGVITNVLDNGDGYIVAGWVSRDSSGNIIMSNTCMWVMKLDYSGNIVWNKTHGLTSYYEDKDPSDESNVFMNGVNYSLAKTTDGGIIIAGRHLVKLNAQGDIEWSKTNSFDGAIKGIRTLPGNGMILTVYADQTNTNAIVKTNDTGDILWSKKYNATGVMSGFTAVEVMTNASGDETGYLLGGKVIYPERRSTDCLLAALDTHGNIVWDYTFNGVTYDESNMIFSEDEITTIIKSNDGNYLVGITSESFNSELNDTSPIVVKVDKDGNFLWEKSYDVYGSRMMKMAPTAKGFVFTGDLDGGGDWHSLIVTADESGNVPDHGKSLSIRNIEFMVERPESSIVDVTDNVLKNNILVSDNLYSIMKEIKTDRVRR